MPQNLKEAKKDMFFGQKTKLTAENGKFSMPAAKQQTVTLKKWIRNSIVHGDLNMSLLVGSSL